MEAPSETLHDIAKEIDATGKPRWITVRQILTSIGQERRGKHVTRALRESLKQLGLCTEPDFENAHIDAQLILSRVQPHKAPHKVSVTESTSGKGIAPLGEQKMSPKFDASSQTNGTAPQPIDLQKCDLDVREGAAEEASEREIIVTIRQGIKAAGEAPPLIRRNASVQHALTLLMDRNVDHLIVAQGERNRVEGVFTWQSYGRAVLAGRTPDQVGSCMSQDFAEINEEKPLFDAVREVIRHRIVVVRSRENRICGLVTAKEATEVFVELAEPFLFLGQIENHLRDLLGRINLSAGELRSLVDERDEDRASRTTRVDDLTLGELIRAFENPDIWHRLGLKHDKSIIIKRLKRVRETRNKVMHFDSDGLLPDEKMFLKETRRFLQEI